MTISPDETEIVGSWTGAPGSVIGDEANKRIRALVDNYLRYLGATPDGWSRLYSDPQDGRHWELYFPRGEMHGGGPPALRVVSIEHVRQHYKLKDT